MKFDWKQPGYITSAIAHMALLLAALLAFSDTQKFDDAQESIAVEVISEAQLNDVTKGDKSAKDIKPKPKVDKVAETEVQKPTPPTPLAKTDVPTPVPPLKPQIDPGQDPVPEAKPVAEAKPVPTPPVKPVEPPKPDIKPDPPKPEPRPAAEPPKVADTKPEPAKPEPVKPVPAPPVPKPVTRPQPDEPNPEAEVVRPAPPKTQDLAKLIEKTTPPEPPKPKVRPRDKTPAAETPDKNALKQQIDAAAEKAKLDQKLADDAAKEKAVQDKALKDKAVKDAATKQAALDKAADLAQEKADQEKADKEKADKDKAAKAAADKSAAEKAAALLKPKAGDTPDAPKKDVLGDISKFLSKDKPQNTGSSGKVASAEPAAGTATASAAKMSQNLKAQLNGWLKDKYHACWSLPITLPTGSKYVPKIQVTFNSDGSLAGAPRLANPPSDPAFNALAASARAAVVNPDCNPLKIPPHFQAFFNEWKDSTISFDPEDQ